MRLSSFALLLSGLLTAPAAFAAQAVPASAPAAAPVATVAPASRVVPSKAPVVAPHAAGSPIGGPAVAPSLPASHNPTYWHVASFVHDKTEQPKVIVVGSSASASAPADVMTFAVHPGSSQDRMRGVLRSGAIAGTEDNALHGITPSQIVTITRADGRGTVQAIIKAANPEREVAASNLSEHLGLDFVPPTTYRLVNGVRSSVQLMAPNLKRAFDQPTGTMNRDAAEKFRVFDFIIGNQDRHGNNVLVQTKPDGELYPVLIDHNLALLDTPSTMRVDGWHQLVKGETGPLLPSTKAFIAGIDPKEVARVLAGSGLSKPATTMVLRRIERLKQDASFLEIDHIAEPKLTPYEYVNPSLSAVSNSADQGLRPEALQRIDQIVAGAYGAKP